MRLVLMGTGPFAGPAFQALIDSDGHEVAALVTRPQPQRPGRKAPPANPVRSLTREKWNRRWPASVTGCF